eukprot:788634-Amphidinium_carterae.1
MKFNELAQGDISNLLVNLVQDALGLKQDGMRIVALSRGRETSIVWFRATGRVTGAPSSAQATALLRFVHQGAPQTSTTIQSKM